MELLESTWRSGGEDTDGRGLRSRLTAPPVCFHRGDLRFFLSPPPSVWPRMRFVFKVKGSYFVVTIFSS